ncbi:MAG: hypothetical protein JWQ08_1792 [Deinococcus sp.]|nr:hypothetical protein [Deinococcus sp.]
MSEDELLAALRERVAYQATDEVEDARVGAPLTAADVQAAALELQLSLPALLERVVTELGNGGWGPGYGLYPLLVPEDQRLNLSVAELDTSSVQWMSECCPDGWPRHLLFLAYWGCNVSSILDLKDGRVGIFDFSLLDDTEDLTAAPESILWQAESLHEWLTRWVDGESLFYEVDDA